MTDPMRLINSEHKDSELSAKDSEFPFAVNHGNEPQNAVAFPKKMWPRGKAIIVCFLDGDSAQHNFVKKCWAEYEVNLTFAYVGCGDRDRSDVRITFESEGFKSFIGNTQVSKDKATMKLGIKIWDRSPELRAQILHEGMHMLGFGHEHASPKSSIKWNVDEVYKHSKTSYGWDSKETRTNVLSPYPADQVDATEYDPKSIMHYPVHQALTKDGFCVLDNLELSELDKKKLKSMYAANPHSGVDHASLPTLLMALTSLPVLTLAITFQLARKLVKLVGLYGSLVLVLVLGAACVHKLI